MRNLMSGMGLRPPNGALKSSDMRKSNPDKGMTLCRYFGGKCICVCAFRTSKPIGPLTLTMIGIGHGSDYLLRG